MAPAKTGRERSNKIAVIIIDQAKRGSLSKEIFLWCIFKIVEIKLIAPKIEDIPAICKEKIDISTEGPLWNIFDVRGGYKVHPAPTPLLIKFLSNNNIREGGNSQNLILFIRGYAISGAPSIKGIKKFPKPPIIKGITIKKIIMKACLVTKVL